MNKIFTAVSNNARADKAVSEVYDILNKQNAALHYNVSCIMFFASSMYASDILVEEFNRLFPQIVVFGCSTAGELASGYLGTHSLVAVAFDRQTFPHVCVETVDDLSKHQDEFPRIIKSLEEQLGSSLSSLDRKQYFGLIHLDGLSFWVEKFLDTFGEYTNIEFTGGSAGDDLAFQHTTIYANGKCYKNNAGVVAIVKCNTNFAIKRYQHFNFTGLETEVTKSDPSKRIIYELDGKPAAERYCELLEISPEEVSRYAVTHPIGFKVNDLPFVRSIKACNDDGSFEMYCNVLDGARLCLLEPDSLLGSTRLAIKDIRRKYQNISGMVVYNCILRYLEILQNNQAEEFAELFSDIPTAGFCTYGEYYIGLVNQTMTVLIVE